MTKNIQVHYVGQLWIEETPMTLSCRTLNGKKAYGLDVKIDHSYKDFLAGLDAEWDSVDRVWYFVYGDINEIVRRIADISTEMQNRIHDQYVPELKMENGFLNESKIDAFFRANSESEACL